MKYKPNATTQPLTQKEGGKQKKLSNCLFSDILKCKRKTSEHNALANKSNTVEQLKSLSINNKGESPSKSTSSTSQSQEKSRKQQIKQFQQEVYYL